MVVKKQLSHTRAHTHCWNYIYIGQRGLWGGGVTPQNMNLLSSQKLHTQFRWNLTTTFIICDVQKFVHGIKKTVHRHLLSSPLLMLWDIHAYQWFPGCFIQPLLRECPVVLFVMYSVFLCINLSQRPIVLRTMLEKKFDTRDTYSGLEFEPLPTVK